MTENSLPEPPVTGNHEIDAACAALDLAQGIDTHPDQISAVLDTFQRLLSGPSVPQALKPRA